MSAKNHSINTTNKQLTTPLKASVVLVSAMLVAACGTNGSQSYNMENVFGSSTIIYKPKAPKDTQFSENGTKLTGKAEANAIVKIKDSSGNEIGTTKADANGDFQYTFKEPLTKGETVEVEAYYPNGTRPSDTVKVEAPDLDITEPEEPTDPTDPEVPGDGTPNEPEANKSGVQSINVGTSVAGLADFIITTRDFEIEGNTVVARADLASNNLLPKVKVNISGAEDKDLTNGFKSHDDTTSILTALGDLPLSYTSTYKDFGEEMRIGHIDGTATLNGINIPVNGVAAIGNATKAENMPKEGKVDYAGDATHRKLGIGNAIEFGSSVFTADFVAKTVDGKLKFDKAGEINLTADIKGNKFSGKAEANKGYATEGGFFGGDADYIGGIYEGNEAQGTYGAKTDKQTTPTDPVDPVDPVEPAPVNPDVKPDTQMTGFQSTALSSTKRTLPFGAGELENAIGYQKIRGDKETWSGDQKDVAADGTLPDNKVLQTGDNFTAFNKLSLRADMVKPDSVQKPLDIALDTPKKITVEAGKGSLNPDFVYKSVYENFDQQMQVGHVYGHINSGFVGDLSRVANVYVQGHLTNQADIDYLKQVNEGKAQYTGKATYIENIHLGDGNTGFDPVNGTSAFNVDFVNNSVKGQLEFAAGNYKYMPTGNKITIDADITGNTFAGNKNGIDTAGGFYGEDAKFLGGIYQDASVPGGKGDVAGTGTKFQGTFGAEIKK